VHASIVAEQTPLKEFDKLIESGAIARVPGTAVFLTRANEETPPVLAWHVKQNRSLHEDVLALTFVTRSTPRVAAHDRLSIKHESDHFWRAEAYFGFMERPDLPTVLADCKMRGAKINLDDVVYYVGHETVVRREDGKGLPRFMVAIFDTMGRNASRISDTLRLPHDNVVEIGREVAI
jgi:KUP system potassium uptake protein